MTDNLSAPAMLKVINTAILLAEREDVSPEYRQLLVDLLSIITDYQYAIEELGKQKHESSINDYFKASEEVVYDENDRSLLAVSQRVQAHLSKNHSELMSTVHKGGQNSSTIKSIIKQFVIQENLVIKHKDAELTQPETLKALYSEVLQFSVLDDFMMNSSEDPKEFIEEIRVDDFNDIRVVRAGREERTSVEFDSPAHALEMAYRLIRMSGQDIAFSQKNPFARVRIGDTTRVSLMRSPIARRDTAFAKGDVVQFCIRKQRKSPFTAEFLLSTGSVGSYAHSLLCNGIEFGVPMCFYGGTGTGKTAVMNAYMHFLTSRTITMAEIDEMNHRKVDMERFIIDEYGKPQKNLNYGKPFNSSLMWESPDLEMEVMPNKKGFTGMLNAALTFTPEAMVLQESKAGEIKDVIEAAISGHQVFTTVHAHSPETFFTRILLMYQQSGANISDHLIMKQVPQAFPWIVNLKRYKDGSRKVASITELMDYDTMTGRFRTRTLAKFEVSGSQIIDGKLKILGEHSTYKLPSNRSFELMRENGIPEAKEKEMMAVYENTKASSIPIYIDNYDYVEE